MTSHQANTSLNEGKHLYRAGGFGKLKASHVEAMYIAARKGQSVGPSLGALRAEMRKRLGHKLGRSF